MTDAGDAYHPARCMPPLDDFRVQVRCEGTMAVISPHGEIDVATVDAVREQVAACEADASTLVLDLRGVAFMDTSGLQLVFELHRRATEGTFAFAVVRGPRQLQRLFDIAGFGDRLRLLDDPAEAA